jgi:aspartate/methionine/tyrosine aminotransferase
MKGISKEFPWPGARCGWVEFYNRNKSVEFNKYCAALENAKMIEVCSTKLPQMAIPKIMSAPQYANYQKKRNQDIGKRSKIITDILNDTPTITFNETFGAFYNTIIFKKGVLKPDQKLYIDDPRLEAVVDQWMEADPHMALDKRFVYYLLAAKGVCVVPISSFCSDLQGFRVTLLEENEALLKETFTLIKEAVVEYTEANVAV